VGTPGKNTPRDPLSIQPSPGTGCLLAMVRDQYGNYVVQRILESSDAKQRAEIVLRMRAQFLGLKSIPYGKVIISKVEALTGENFLPIDSHDGTNQFVCNSNNNLNDSV
jgi:hypothetical protein